MYNLVRLNSCIRFFILNIHKWSKGVQRFPRGGRQFCFQIWHFFVKSDHFFLSKTSLTWKHLKTPLEENSIQCRQDCGDLWFFSGGTFLVHNISQPPWVLLWSWLIHANSRSHTKVYDTMHPPQNRRRVWILNHFESHVSKVKTISQSKLSKCNKRGLIKSTQLRFCYTIERGFFFLGIEKSSSNTLSANFRLFLTVLEENACWKTLTLPPEPHSYIALELWEDL